MEFKIQSDFIPTGDQPQAISQLVDGVTKNEPAQTLLGVTGSGKTFTVANVIKEVNKPTLVLSHNKTLAAQLYGELKQFFPDNAVEYFISYYDYYQPEAFIPSTNLYIEKDLSINEEIEKLRLSATSALLTGRRDVIVVASVSCIYGIGNPEEFGKNVIRLQEGDVISRNQLLFQLVDILYSRTEGEFKRGNFRVKGDTVDIFIAYDDFAYRIYFFGDEIEAIHRVDPATGKKLGDEKIVTIFPANLFVTGREVIDLAVREIQDDLVNQIEFFETDKRFLEAKRIKERTEFDMEMIRELGYCSGVENYSRYFDRRSAGARPFCLLDYFPEDYLMVVDESHVTMPQVRAMWGGDRSRKVNLVDYGFRLPSALDNRPLTFNEFEEMINQVIFVSATPGEYELRKAEGIVVEQLIRPTGLLDPQIDVRPSLNQIDDLIEEIHKRAEKDERVLVTTLTKRVAEELTKYLENVGIKCRYIHSEVNVLDRVEILRELRLGVFDVLVGVNLLREGLDLPEVSMVAILDADKEGFLRNVKSLVQTIGRAARNVNGLVVMYADTVTDSMRIAIDETNRRRGIQMAYNEKHGITPSTVTKSKGSILEQTKVADSKKSSVNYYTEDENPSVAADPVVSYMSGDEIEKLIKQTKRSMEKAAKDLDFIEAARLRDELFELQSFKTKEKQRMPELPEVEVYRQYFDGTSLGHKIVSIEIDDPRLVKVPADDFKARLTGAAFAGSDRIGKFFFAHTSTHELVVFHFGLTGNFYYFNETEDQPRFTRVLFHFDNGFKLAFVNMRKFGWVDLTDDLEAYRQKKNLGPDAQKITFEDFYQKFRRRKSFVKPKLLDQKLMAGVGNWIADEILYQSQLHPESLIENLSDEDLKTMYDKMQHILEVAVREDANYKAFPDYFFIHIRKGKDARCFHTGGPIEKIEVGGRGTYFSPDYQVLK